jgi:hypothetical protein
MGLYEATPISLVGARVRLAVRLELAHNRDKNEASNVNREAHTGKRLYNHFHSFLFKQNLALKYMLQSIQKQ